MRTCRYTTDVSRVKCENLAEWEIYWGSEAELDCTESCTRHVGDMLIYAIQYRIYPIISDPLDIAIDEAEQDLRVTVPEMFGGKPMFYKPIAWTTSMSEYDHTQSQEIEAILDVPPPCTVGCVINSRVGGDHAYCECVCHAPTLPAIPPSRIRREPDYEL